MSLSLFAYGYSANLDTDQDRAHCLLDLRGVSDAASAGRFIARWRRELEGYLNEPPEDEVALDVLRDEANKAEAEAERLGGWIEDFAQQVDRIADDVFDLEDGQPLSNKLAAIVETMNRVAGGEDPD